MSDAELLERINQNKEKRKKYKAVMDAIQSNYLNSSRSNDLSSMEDFVEKYMKKVETIDSDSGYSYLSTLSIKLKRDLEEIEDYLDYAKDSVKSLTEMYETLKQKKDTLDSKINNDVDKYNEDKHFWEHQGKGDGLLW